MKKSSVSLSERGRYFYKPKKEIFLSTCSQLTDCEHELCEDGVLSILFNFLF